jgi:hypothetical protein
MLMLEGALIALGAFLLGRVLPGRRRTPKPAPPPRPICDCRHSISFHTDGTGGCAWVGEKFYKSGCGAITPKCTCLRYVGPTPLPEYFANEISAT